MISRSPYSALNAPKQETNYRKKHQVNAASSVDITKHADGHMARVGGRFGSFPMHEKYGDEATGQERDYEEYFEHVANYG